MAKIEPKLLERKNFKSHQINALHSIEKAIISNCDILSTLDILLEMVTTQLHIDAANILLLNLRTQMLEHVISRGFRSNALQYTKLKLGESNAGSAALERRIIIVPNLQQDGRGFVRSEFFRDEDFVTYIAVPLIIRDRVLGVLELFHRKLLRPESEWLEFLDTLADLAAIAIDNASLFNEICRLNGELTVAYDTTIEGWSRALDLRDKETKGHTQRVTEITTCIAHDFAVREEEMLHVRRGALLHDIGKMGISDSILLKEDKLTVNEWEIIKLHPIYAYEMIFPIEYLRPALNIPFCHHEKWDGTGYPRGLKGEAIPLEARIFAVVDVWDALSSNRPYRSAWSRERVFEHISSQAGTHFDPEVAELFLDMDL